MGAWFKKKKKTQEVGLLRIQATRPLQECSTTKASSMDRECPW